MALISRLLWDNLRVTIFKARAKDVGCGTTSDVRAHNKEQRHARNDRNRTLSVRRLQRERVGQTTSLGKSNSSTVQCTVHGTLCWVCVIFPNGNAMMTGLCDDVCTRAQHQQCSASFLFFITKQQFQSRRQQQDPAPAPEILLWPWAGGNDSIDKREPEMHYSMGLHQLNDQKKNLIAPH